MLSKLSPGDPVDAIAIAWLRERPGTSVQGIGIVTRIWQCAKLLGEDRRRVLTAADADPATLDLLSVLRRCGPPYEMTTRDLSERTLVSAGAISQRVARAERYGLVSRAAGKPGTRSVLVTLTPRGHAFVERLVDGVLSRDAQLVSSLTPHEQDQLTNLLRRFLGNLQAEIGPGAPTHIGSN